MQTKEASQKHRTLSFHIFKLLQGDETKEAGQF